jgi:type IV fimbrial biogenesis protein FimT
MITLLVMALLLRMAVPAWQGFASRATIAGVSNELESDIALARLEAVRRQAQITLCSTSAPDPAAAVSAINCSTAGSDWKSGRWAFCTDPNTTTPTGACCPDGPAACSTPPAVAVLKVRQAVSGGTTTVVGPASAMVFHSNGSITTAATTPLTFTICASGQPGRTLSLGLAGQMLVADSPAVCP